MIYLVFVYSVPRLFELEWKNASSSRANYGTSAEAATDKQYSETQRKTRDEESREWEVEET